MTSLLANDRPFSYFFIFIGITGNPDSIRQSLENEFLPFYFAYKERNVGIGS